MSKPTPPLAEIDNWVNTFPQKKVEERIHALERELARLRRAIEWRDTVAGSNGSAAKADKEGQGKPANRPAAIRRVLRERNNEPTEPAAIKSAVLERGWLTQAESKYFYSAMSTMTKRGHLLRLQDGRYMLSQKYAASRD